MEERDRSVVFCKRVFNVGFLSSGLPEPAERSGEDTCEERCVDNVCECW